MDNLDFSMYDYLYDKDNKIEIGDYIEDPNFELCIVIGIDDHIEIGDRSNLELMSIMPYSNNRIGYYSKKIYTLRKVKKDMVNEYLAAIPYQRNVIENLEMYKNSIYWMGWFGDRIHKFKKQIEFADKLIRKWEVYY
jgi:hypothetical protein